jgi:hypothetical protein
MFLGIPDPSVSVAYILLIMTVLLCTVYGVVKWNSEGEITSKELQDEERWFKEEIELEQDISGGK